MVHDPRYPSRPYGHPILVDKMIGTAYEYVKFVADNIDHIKIVGESIDSINTVEDSLNAINTISENILAVMNVNDHIDQISNIGQNMPAVISIDSNMDALVSLSDNLDAVTEIYENLDVLVEAATILPVVQEYADAAEASATNAATSASNAQDASNLAAGAASSAELASSNAFSYANQANTARTQAINAALDSNNSANASAGSASSADASATASDESAQIAHARAVSAEAYATSAYAAMQGAEQALEDIEALDFVDKTYLEANAPTKQGVIADTSTVENIQYFPWFYYNIANEQELLGYIKSAPTVDFASSSDMARIAGGVPVYGSTGKLIANTPDITENYEVINTNYMRSRFRNAETITNNGSYLYGILRGQSGSTPTYTPEFQVIDENESGSSVPKRTSTGQLAVENATFGKHAVNVDTLKTKVSTTDALFAVAPPDGTYLSIFSVTGPNQADITPGFGSAYVYPNNATFSGAGGRFPIYGADGRLKVGIPVQPQDAVSNEYMQSQTLTVQYMINADPTDQIPIGSTYLSGVVKAAPSIFTLSPLPVADPNVVTGNDLKIARFGAGGRISVGTPTADIHAATKKYVDDRLSAVQRTAIDALDVGTSTLADVINALKAT